MKSIRWRLSTLPVVSIWGGDTISFIKNVKYFDYDLFSTELSKTPIFRCGKKRYSGLFFGLDIEATSLPERKKAISYIQQMGAGSQTVFTRNILDSVAFIKKIAEIVKNYDETCLFVIWVHNLTYEWQFYKNLFKWDKCFFRSVRSILEAVSGNIVFRCSYALSRLSLSKLAKRWALVDKMSGDEYNYSLVRTPSTKLSFSEYKYCFYDIEILRQYHSKVIYTEYLCEGFLPLTATSIVRRSYRIALRRHAKENGLRVSDYHNFLTDCQLNAATYKLARQAFTGGYVHARAVYCGDSVLIDSFDIGSSYPYVMLTKTYPVSPFKRDVFDEEKIEDFCCLFELEMWNVKPKSIHHLISKSKCISLENAKMDNGKVVSASYLKICVTEIDYKLIRDVYTCSSFSVHNFFTAVKGKLPVFLRKTLMIWYQKKNELKGVKGKEDEYMRRKENVNSTFGMMVTDILINDIILDNHNCPIEIEVKNIDERLKESQEKRTAFTLYQWGVWITAHARNHLFRSILLPAEQYETRAFVYSDTDSGKLKGIPEGFFEQINHRIECEVQDECVSLGLSADAGSGLGIICKENKQKILFKTWGAKRYLHRGDNEQGFTVSGINSNKTLEYCKIKKIDAFTFFSEDMVIPETSSGRGSMYYDELTTTEIIKDYQGNVWEGEVGSGCVYVPTEYRMKLAPEYELYVQSERRGRNEMA